MPNTLLIYSRSDAKRLAHVQQNQRVALNFDGNGSGGDIIVFTGHVQISADDPLPTRCLPSIISIKWGEKNRSSGGMQRIVRYKQGETSESMSMFWLVGIASELARGGEAVHVVAPQEAAR